MPDPSLQRFSTRPSWHLAPHHPPAASAPRRDGKLREASKIAVETTTEFVPLMHDGRTFAFEGDVCVVGSKLGGGSFGEVCLLGRQRERRVELSAIKTFGKNIESQDPHLVASKRLQDMARAELDAMKKVRSSLNEAQLIIDSATGHPAIIMPLMLGSLSDVLEQLRSASPVQRQVVAESMLPLGQALRELHAQGLAHMDIKPANIFLTPQGTWCLGDFGLATSEQASSVRRGSMVWMAPEVFASLYAPPGQTLAPFETQPSDLFSLGLVFLNVFVGRNLFDYQDWHHSNYSIVRAAAFTSSMHASFDTLRPALWHWIGHEGRLKPPVWPQGQVAAASMPLYGRQLLEKLGGFNPRHPAVQSAIMLTAKDPRARILAPLYSPRALVAEGAQAALARFIQHGALPASDALARCPLLGHDVRLAVAWGQRDLFHPGLLWTAVTPEQRAADEELPPSLSWASAPSEPLEPGTAGGVPLLAYGAGLMSGLLELPAGASSKKRPHFETGLFGGWPPLKTLFRPWEYGRQGRP